MRIESLPIWERIEASGLLEPAQVAIVRAEVATWKDAALKTLGTAAPDPTALASAQFRLMEWLIGHELLTRYQGQILLTGQATPLEIGPFKLVGQAKDWGLPHHYWVVEKRRTREDVGFNEPQGLALFGERLNATDWAANQRRVARLAQEKQLKSPHLWVPWGSVVAESHCAVLAPPCTELPKSSESGSTSEETTAEVNWTAQSLAQRLAPEFAKANPAPSLKRILQWGLDLATGLTELHERDLPIGFWDPSGVLITANKRAVLCSLPGSYLRTPFLASLLLGGGGPNGDVNLLYQDLLATTTPKSRWTPLDFLPPEIVERLDKTGKPDPDNVGPKEMASERGWATPAADLFCLGTLLAFLLRGSEPTEGIETLEHKLGAKRHAHANLLPPSVPGPIRTLVEKLTSPNPLQRPGAADTAQALRGLLKQSAEPTQAFFNISPAAKLLRETCRTWPGNGWTKELETIKASEIPELIKTVPVPAIVINTQGSPVEGSSATEGEAGVRNDPVGRPASRSHLRRSGRQNSFWSPPIVACCVSGGAALVALLWWIVAGPATNEVAERETVTKNHSPIQTPEEAIVPSQPTGWKQELVPDDGRLLWESPTVGLPLTVDGLPNNPSGLLIVHRDFWKSAATVDPLLRALDGPNPTGYAAAIQTWREAYQVEQFTRVLIGQYQALDRVQHVMLLESETSVEASLPGWKLVASCEIPVITAAVETEASQDAFAEAGPKTSSPVGPDKGENSEIRDKPAPSPTGDDGTSPERPTVYHYLLARGEGEAIEAAWLQLTAPMPADFADGLATAPLDRVDDDTFDPTLSDIQIDDRMLPVLRMLVGTPELVTSAVQNHGQTQFTGTMASLLTFSDAQRHVQLFINPVTIWNAQGQDWLGSRWQWLGQLVKDRVPTAVRMMYLSVHAAEGGETYVEWKVVGDRAQPVGEVLRPILDDLSTMSESVKRSMLGLPRVAYWENALLRYDTMLNDVSGLVRAGQHDRVPTLNVWLRPHALSNLAAATEIYFTAINAGGGGTAVVSNQPITSSSSGPKDLSELLRSSLSLNIPEQDLINALVELETEIKTTHPELPFQFSIELDGNSLRLDGITQNQKITNFNQQDRPLAEILTALVLKANPDPAVTSARDPKCKLIWLVDPARPEGQIRVTTRGAAQENGWTLPPEVQPE